MKMMLLFKKMFSANAREIRTLFAIGIFLALAFSIENTFRQPTPRTRAQAPIEYPDGTLLRAQDRSAVFVIFRNKKKHVPDANIFASYGYRFQDVRTIDETTLERIPDVKLIRVANNPKVYYLDRGQKHWIRNESAFESYGVPWDEIMAVNSQDLSLYREARQMRAEGDEKVYYITQNGLRRHIPNPEVFTSYGSRWEEVITTTAGDVFSYPVNVLVKTEVSPKVYMIAPTKNGMQKRWITSLEAFRRMGFDWKDVAPINLTEFTAYPEGDSIFANEILAEPIKVVQETLSAQQRKIKEALDAGLQKSAAGDVLLKETKDYQLVYLAGTDTFLVWVKGRDFEGIRRAGENDLLALLGISKNTYCGLKIKGATPAYVNRALAGQEFSSVICP